MDVTITISGNAFDNKQAFGDAILSFIEQVIIAKMTMNYRTYEKNDAFCANVLMLEEMRQNGTIPETLEEELGRVNRRLNMDWIGNV